MSQKLFPETDLPEMIEVSNRLHSLETLVNESMLHGGIRGYSADAHIRINKESLITVVLNLIATPSIHISTTHTMAVAFAHGVIAAVGYEDVLVKPAL